MQDKTWMLHGSEAFICKALKAETIVKLCLDFNPPASPERLAMAGVGGG